MHSLSMLARRALCGLLLAGLAFVLGCGGAKTGNVEGEVLYRNKPVTGGQIGLFNDKGESVASNMISPSGHYSFNGVAPGTYKVTVNTLTLKSGGIDMNRLKNTPDMKGKGFDKAGQLDKSEMGTFVNVPRKYMSPNTTDLKVTVKLGSSKEDITLKD